MGSRCWECGEKFGRCYEHAGMCDCPVHSCSSFNRVVEFDFEDNGPPPRAVRMRPVPDDELNW